MNREKQIKYLSIAAAISVLMSIFGFISLSWNEPVSQKILIVICSFLLLTLCVLYVYIIYLSIDREPNYFLYDRISEHNIPLSSLNWKIVDDKLNGYISEKLGGRIHLWTSNIIGDTKKYEYGGALQSLIAYKMLYDVAVSLDSDQSYFVLFESTELDNICTIGRLLEKNGDIDMARVIVGYRSRGGNVEKFRKYLRSNAKYIQSRMVLYVRNNIEKFY